eukprot:m.108991 g.108991  ORF g.108991 m.108991 type:complete len:498 (-) comp12724_c1_seq2:255-1748(-)
MDDINTSNGMFGTPSQSTHSSLKNAPTSTSTAFSHISDEEKIAVVSKLLDNARKSVKTHLEYAVDLLKQCKQLQENLVLPPEVMWKLQFVEGKVLMSRGSVYHAIGLFLAAKKTIQKANVDTDINLIHITLAQAFCVHLDQNGSVKEYELAQARDSVSSFLDAEGTPLDKSHGERWMKAVQIKCKLLRFSGDVNEELAATKELLTFNRRNKNWKLLTPKEEETTNIRLLHLIRTTSSKTEHPHGFSDMRMHKNHIRVNSSNPYTSPERMAQYSRNRSCASVRNHPGILIASEDTRIRSQSDSRTFKSSSSSSSSSSKPRGAKHKQHVRAHAGSSSRRPRSHTSMNPTAVYSPSTPPVYSQAHQRLMQQHMPMQAVKSLPNSPPSPRMRHGSKHSHSSFSSDSSSFHTMSLEELREIRHRKKVEAARIEDAILQREVKRAYKEGKEHSSSCSVCLDEKVGVCLLPCRHTCLCVDCSKDVSVCPICRTKVEDKMTVFVP